MRRAVLIHDCHPTPHAWPIAAGWALLALVGGSWFFWRIEERYGRG